jgi:CYTH domain-containing protein
MDRVERVIERAQAAGTSREIIVLLSVLRAEFMYKIGLLNSQIMATMVERSIDALGKAHVMVTEYGDIWLEVKVLRGLERGYVQVLVFRV